MTARPKPLQSKKWTAWLIMSLTWKAILVACLLIVHGELEGSPMMLWWLMLTIVMTAGLGDLFYLGGQALVDRYTAVLEAGLDKIDGDDNNGGSGGK